MNVGEVMLTEEFALKIAEEEAGKIFGRMRTLCHYLESSHLMHESFEMHSVLLERIKSHLRVKIRRDATLVVSQLERDAIVLRALWSSQDVVQFIRTLLELYRAASGYQLDHHAFGVPRGEPMASAIMLRNIIGGARL